MCHFSCMQNNISHCTHADFEQNITFSTHSHDKIQKVELFWLTETVENIFDFVKHHNSK